MNAFIYEWTGEAMQPLRSLAKLCDKEFVIGLRYRMEVIQQRSKESHDHYFACLDEAWNNLPEICAGRWLSREHLRKWALCQTEFRNEVMFITKSKAEALRCASLVHKLDEYAEVQIDGCMIAVYTAKSQRMHGEGAMSRKEFQASKDAVLDIMSKLIGVPVEELTRHAGKAA